MKKEAADGRLLSDLRVFFIVAGSGEGSSMIFVRRQIQALRDSGVDTWVFYLSSRTSLPLLVQEWRRVRKEIAEFQPDLVHSQFGTVTALFATFATTSPIVVTYRGSDLNWVSTTHWLRRLSAHLFSQWAVLRAKRIICVSPQLVEKLWWRKDTAVVIPSGIDTKVFYPRDQDQARSELGWDPQEKAVLFNASGSPKIKRLDLAEAAVDVAQDLTGAIRFEVLDGGTDPALVPLLMNAADCLLLTSDSEGSPNVVKEAIACNLPVVTVAVGDVRERLNGVVPSMIVDRDPGCIGRALAAILDRRERSNGAQYSQDFSMDETTARHLALYDDLLQRPVDSPLPSAFRRRK